MLILAVDRDEELGLGDGEHHLQVALAGVARNVDLVHGLVNDLGPQLQQVVDHPGHVLFVAGDGGGGDDDIVVGGDADLPVLAGGHPGQGGQRFALAAGGADDQPVGGVAADVVDVHQDAVGDVQVPQLDGLGDDVDHAPAGDGHLPPGPHRHVDDLLDPVDVGG